MNLWMFVTWIGCGSSEPTLAGRVVDVWGTPVTDATVIVVGQAERPFTDSNGRYTLNRQQGQWRIKVGKEGFVPVVSELNIEEDTVDIPEITLWPQPTENGFYLLGDDRYIPLQPYPVTRKGNALKSHRGLTSLGNAILQNAPLQVLFHTDLRPDQGHRLNPTLTSLKYLEEAELPSALGATVNVNLYVSDRDIPLNIETLPTRTDYLLSTGTLDEGAYALSTQHLLSQMSANAFQDLPDELKVAWPFQH